MGVWEFLMVNGELVIDNCQPPGHREKSRLLNLMLNRQDIVENSHTAARLMKAL